MTFKVTMNTDGSGFTSGNYPIASDSSGTVFVDSGVGPSANGTFSHSNNVNSNATIFEFNPTGSLLLLSIKWSNTNQQYSFTAEDDSIGFFNVEANVNVPSGEQQDVILDGSFGFSLPMQGYIATVVSSAPTIYYVNEPNTSPGIIKYNSADPFSGKYIVGLTASSSLTYIIEFTTKIVPQATPVLFTTGFWNLDVS